MEGAFPPLPYFHWIFFFFCCFLRKIPPYQNPKDLCFLLFWFKLDQTSILVLDYVFLFLRITSLILVFN
uniref:Uncharacterized protein n=1 Tax=Rhizophora mucronata TaxID=61149 RepID=A0A2P2PNV8_RHIMU